MRGLRTKIDCCYQCTRPWKSTTCHASCPDYTGQRAELDESKRIINRNAYIASGVQEQKYDRITKAVKRRRSW